MAALNSNTIVAVIGLGYVGLPLAVEFGKKFKTIGYDLSADKVDAYGRHVDPTGEVSGAELEAELPPEVRVAFDGLKLQP